MRAARLIAPLLLSAAGAAPPPPSAGGKRPHIIFAVADDLGWNDVSFHGSRQVPTPNIDALAASGVQLMGYYVQPVCSPTRACFMTGRHVMHTAIYDPDCAVGTRKGVRPEFTMLPRHLRGLGYSTHAIGKWHLGMYTPDLVPTGRGFDTFYGYYNGDEDYYSHKFSGHRDFHDDVGAALRADGADDGGYSTTLYAARAQRVIAEFAARAGAAAAPRAAPRSLFIYLAWQAIHSPEEVPSQYKQPFAQTINHPHRRTVAGMISALDEGMGKVVGSLRDAGLWNDTLLIFGTDNGGPVGGFNDNMASNWPLRGMKRTLWEGGVRGVGLITGAGLRKTGYASSELYHAVDWMPSLLAVALNGVDADPGGAGWLDWRTLMSPSEPAFELGDGVDAWRSLATGSPSPRTEIVHEAHPGHHESNGQAIRVGDYKLILEKGPQWHEDSGSWYPSGSDPEKYAHSVDCGGPVPGNGAADYCHPKHLPCLFNIRADPCEYHDLSKSMPDKVAELTARLADYARTAQPASFHVLPACGTSGPAFRNGTWMPWCPAAAAPAWP